MDLRKVGAGVLAAGTLATGGTIAVDRQIDPYSDKGSHYELPIQADIPQGERVEIAKDRAAMTLKGWNDEYAITITPQLPMNETARTTIRGEEIDRTIRIEADRPLLSKKMEYRQGDVTAFIEPREGTENEFDIDFTLDAKPDTNVFEYRIEGAEEFDFFYQPPEEGRDENVIGSYAVYHKTKANHRIGSTNYATGKVMHIYRPKAIDANGAEVWAELNYENGLLSVTVQQTFLDEAVYPVVVDPTFGYTTLGATAETGQWYANGFTGVSRLVGRAFTISEGGRLESITISIDADSAETLDFSAALYREDSAGSGSHVQVALSQKTDVSVSTTQRFETFTASGETLTADAYIIAGIGDEADLAGSEEVRPMKDTGATDNNYAETNVSYAAMIAENPWTETAAAIDQVYSFYATYTCTDVGDTCTNTFDTAGDTTWTVPTGVTSADVACWGGGGGGETDVSASGAGGGGGAFASSTVAVTPGNNYTVTVASTSPATLPAIGKFSKFVGNDKTVLACGGTGATSVTLNGVGGTTACSTGDVEAAGGNGGDGADPDGGGGGGAGGPAGAGVIGEAAGAGSFGDGGAGNNGSGGAGGATSGAAGTSNSTGGGGGAGADTTGNGGTGGTPGAGGGGGAGSGAGPNTGGTGAAGQCTITYTIAAAEEAAPSDYGIIWFD